MPHRPVRNLDTGIRECEYRHDGECSAASTSGSAVLTSLSAVVTVMNSQLGAQAVEGAPMPLPGQGTGGPYRGGPPVALPSMTACVTGVAGLSQVLHSSSGR